MAFVLFHSHLINWQKSLRKRFISFFLLIFELINSKTWQTKIHFLEKTMLLLAGMKGGLYFRKIMMQHENCINFHPAKVYLSQRKTVRNDPALPLWHEKHIGSIGADFISLLFSFLSFFLYFCLPLHTPTSWVESRSFSFFTLALVTFRSVLFIFSLWIRFSFEVAASLISKSISIRCVCICEC